jgi:hypothetical protein
VKAADVAYREALGLPAYGPLPKTIGTVAPGASASRRRAADRNRNKISAPPR